MQAAEVYNMYARGLSGRDIAEHFKVSPNTIYRILRRPMEEKEPKPLMPCGTNAAYARHIKNGELADAACLKAHAEERARWAANDPNHKEKRKQWNDARYARAQSESKSTGVPISVLLSVRKSTKGS
jgi:transposase